MDDELSGCHPERAQRVEGPLYLQEIYDVAASNNSGLVTAKGILRLFAVLVAQDDTPNYARSLTVQPKAHSTALVDQILLPDLHELLDAVANAAALLYAEVNRLDPPYPPDDRQRQAVEDLCPRLLTTRPEWFGLSDCAAIHHPVDPVIGFHFFWEDDWDYPDDDEPCDHEVVWVECGRLRLCPSK